MGVGGIKKFTYTGGFLKNEYRLSGTQCNGALPPLAVVLGGGGVVGVGFLTFVSVGENLILFTSKVDLGFILWYNIPMQTKNGSSGIPNKC